jgi:cell division protein FtsI (penicillin-binding protein 3)
MAVILFLWAMGILGRLVLLQVVQHAKYAAMAKRQQEDQLAIAAPRGSIFDRNGQPLAISVPVDSVSVNPMQIADLKNASQILGPMLNLDQAVLYQRLVTARANHKGFFWVKHKMDPFETERLKSLHLEYATFHTESERHYPNGQVASHVLGGLGMIPSEGSVVQGVLGVERSLDKTLRGQDGSERVLHDVKHRGLASQVETVAHEGTKLTLTIDERMQFVAERELKAAVLNKHARSGSAIIMNPYTGEILALTSYPTYNPNEGPKEGDDVMSRWNLSASVPFEPGSIFKVVTLSAALETTNLTPDTLIATGNGTLVLPGRIVHESHHGYGTITMQQVLEKSSNIGAIMIGAKVGRENMYEYARRFGFGQKSGLPLPAESAGLLRPLSKWGTTSLASISMGQEVSTTSVQLARACAVFANGGMLVKPKLVLKRGDTAEPTEPPVRILKPDTVMKMRMMMEGVVLRGTARGTARLDGYTSAGKTGTAQIFDRVTKHYTHSYNASFMGFAPVTNPRLVVVVTVNGTAGDGGMGASAAGPAFNVIATEALRMLDVPRDIPEEEMALLRKPVKNVPKEDVPIAGLGGYSIMDEDPSVRQLLAEQMLTVPSPALTTSIPAAGLSGSAGTGEVHAQATQAGVPPAATASAGGVADPAARAASGQTGAVAQNGSTGSTPPVVARSQEPIVPDFRGKSMRDAVAAASESGIEVMVEGSGVARAQLPPPGTPLHRGDKIRIVFTR